MNAHDLKRAVCEKLQSFQILKLQVDQREKMNKHSAKSQNTQHSISTANKKKSFTITTVSFFNKMDFDDLEVNLVQRLRFKGVKVDGPSKS